MLEQLVMPQEFNLSNLTLLSTVLNTVAESKMNKACPYNFGAQNQLEDLSKHTHNYVSLLW